MAKRKGICKNIDDDCGMYGSREVQEVETTAPFVCSECGKPLLSTDGKQRKKGPGTLVILIIAAVVVIGGATGAWFGGVKDTGFGKKIIAVITKDNGTVKPKRVEYIALDKSDITLVAGSSETLFVTVAPAFALEDNLEWASEDTEVATVKNGTVKAIAKGETTIEVWDSKGGPKARATCVIRVKEKESTGKNEYGTWTGGTRNNMPHGTQIKFTFTKSHLIDRRDPKKRKAAPGDYVIGEYDNGILIHGRWYKKAGGFESIIIGK